MFSARFTLRARHPRGLILQAVLGAWCSVGQVSPIVAAESSNAPVPIAELAPGGQRASDDLLRSFLQVQEQLHNLQLSVDSSRQEAALAAAHDSNVLSARLQVIEQALVTQRERELEAIQNSTRLMLTVAGAFLGVGFVALVVMAWFQWHTINRLAEFSSLIPPGHLLGPGGLQVSDARLLAGPALQSNQRLLGNLERLEKRIIELEHAAEAAPGELAPNQTDSAPVGGNAHGKDEGALSTKAKVLLAKGQSLLAMEKAEEALATFEEVLKCEPHNTEAMLKKAAALESLGNLEEALETCDRAIAADRGFTLAYLQKGGVLNRLERFEEALVCYEAALQSKGG